VIFLRQFWAKRYDRLREWRDFLMVDLELMRTIFFPSFSTLRR
jgi:hypothetical protein